MRLVKFCAVFIACMCLVGSQALRAADDLTMDGHSGSISGRVIDRDTRQPLHGVIVSIPSSAWQTATDSKGDFTLAAIDVGTYTVRFSLIDCVPLLKSDIIVKSNKATRLEVEFDVNLSLSENVTVTSGYFQSAEQPVSQVNFSAEEIRRSAGGIGDISRMLTSLPSVAKTNDGANALVVRGGNPAENKFYVDNIEIPNINHFPIPGSTGGHIGLLNVDFIQDINFYCGGFSALYGDALSSVMDITYRQGARDKLNMQFNLDMSGAGGTMEGPIGKESGSWMLSAHRSYLDLIWKLVGGTGVAPQYNDIQGKVVFDLSPNSRLTFLTIIGLDKMDYDKNSAHEDGNAEYGNGDYSEGTVGMNWFYAWSEKGYSNTSLSFSFNRTQFSFHKILTDALSFNDHTQDASLVLRNVNHYQFSGAANASYGFEVKRQFHTIHFTLSAATNELGIPIPAQDVNFAPNFNLYSAFSEFSMLFFSCLDLHVGVRGDYYANNTHFLISPRFSLALKLSERMSLNGAAGIFRQALPALLLGENNINRADLKDPYCSHLTLGIAYLLSSSVLFTLEAYDKEYTYLPLDPNQPGLFLFDAMNEGGFLGYSPLSDHGEAYTRGIELSIQKKFKDKIYGMVSVSYFRSRYKDLFGVWRDRSSENQLMFTIDGGFKPNRYWEFSLRWMYAGGTPFTPYDVVASMAAGEGRLDISRINADRRPAYHALNLRFDRRFYFGRSNLTTYFMLWNAYNRQNVADRYWNVVKQQPDWVKQWSLMPVGGVQFEF